MTKIQKRFVELDRQKETIKQFYEEYNKAVENVVKELNGNTNRITTGHTFTDDQGVIYETQIAKGRFVYYEKYQIIHTKRPTESRGSLSQKKAKTITKKGSRTFILSTPETKKKKK